MRILSLTLLLIACEADIPEGVYGCTTTDDCPSGFVCQSERCVRPSDAGFVDAPVGDVQSDQDECDCQIGPVCALLDEVVTAPDSTCDATCLGGGAVLVDADACDTGICAMDEITSFPVCCTGCRAPNGVCEDGLSETSCGVGGVLCQECASGSVCQEGTCCRSIGSAAGGLETACLIDDDGGLFCWGPNTYGEVGVGTTVGVGVPTLVELSETWRFVDTGGNDESAHTCGVTTGNELYCWGRNSNGQVGVGSFMSPQLTPVLVEGTGWTEVAVGSRHTCGLRDGELFCWGLNGNGSLGLGPGGMTSTTPQRVGTDADWNRVACGTQSCCGLRGTELYCWGANASGQLGTGDTNIRTEPTLIRDGVIDVSVGLIHMCIVSSDSEVFCVGANASSQLGGPAGARLNFGEPVLRGATEIWAGGRHTCALTDTDAFCWGEGADGKLGSGETENSAEPVLVGPATSLALGTRFTCATDERGSARCWGRYPGLADGALEQVFLCVEGG